MPKEYAYDQLILSLPLFAFLMICKSCCTYRCEVLCKPFCLPCFHQELTLWYVLYPVTWPREKLLSTLSVLFLTETLWCHLHGLLKNVFIKHGILFQFSQLQYLDYGVVSNAYHFTHMIKMHLRKRYILVLYHAYSKRLI